MTITRSALLPALQLAAKAASTRTSVVILQNVRLSAEDGTMTIMGCDGELFVEARAQCSSLDSLPATCVPASRLLSSIENAPEGDIDFAVEGNALIVSAKRFKDKMLSLDAQDFPEMTRKELGPKVPAKDIVSAWKTVGPAVSQDIHRAVLTGMYVGTDGYAVATDTHRLHIMKLQGDVLGATVILPSKLVGLLPEGAEMYLGESIVVKGEWYEMIAPQIYGTFPNWQRVQPAEEALSIRCAVEKDALDQAIKRIFGVAKANANRVRIGLSKDLLTLRARSEELGEIESSVDAVYDGEDYETAVNAKYLRDAITPCGDGVRLLFQKSNKTPFLVRDANDDEHAYTAILMPMALQ